MTRVEDKVDSILVHFNIKQSSPEADPSFPSPWAPFSMAAPNSNSLPSVEPSQSHVQQISVDVAPKLSSSSPQRTLWLSDELTITFNEKTIPKSAPAVQSDPDLLFTEWYKSSYLMLGNPPQPIPIRHWDKVFKQRNGSKTGVWNSLRSKWGKWKVITFYVVTF